VMDSILIAEAEDSAEQVWNLVVDIINSE
jgi:hypothetical protein